MPLRVACGKPISLQVLSQAEGGAKVGVDALGVGPGVRGWREGQAWHRNISPCVARAQRQALAPIGPYFRPISMDPFAPGYPVSCKERTREGIPRVLRMFRTAGDRGGGMAGWVGAIDLGGTKTVLALVGPSGLTEQRIRLPTPSRPKPEELTDWLAAQVQAIGSAWMVEAWGVAAPGPVHVGAGVVQEVLDWPWRDIPLANLLQSRLGLPVVVDNDVNCCCLAEMRWGAGRTVDDLAWIQVSTGVGGALCLQRQIYRGACGLAGEVGHLIVQEGGPLCHCGHRGCLQALVSGPAIVRRFAQAGGAAGGGAETVFAAADAGDLRAQGVLGAVADDLGRGIALVVNLLNPQIVVLGGGVMQSFAPYLARAQESMHDRVFGKSNRDVPLLCSEVGYDAALMGAAALAQGWVEKVGERS